MRHLPALKPTTSPRSPVETGTPQPHVPAASRVVLAALRGYKLLLSPMFTGACRFQPSCADYMAEAVSVYGVRRGVWLGIMRLTRCRPFGGHGYDPVPRS